VKLSCALLPLLLLRSSPGSFANNVDRLGPLGVRVSVARDRSRWTGRSRSSGWRLRRSWRYAGTRSGRGRRRWWLCRRRSRPDAGKSSARPNVDEMLALRPELESRSSQVLQLAVVHEQAAGTSSGCSCRAGSPATRTGASVWPFHAVVVGAMARNIARTAEPSTAPVTPRAHKR
jgi:hypothetical protein